MKIKPPHPQTHQPPSALTTIRTRPYFLEVVENKGYQKNGRTLGIIGTWTQSKRNWQETVRNESEENVNTLFEG